MLFSTTFHIAQQDLLTPGKLTAGGGGAASLMDTLGTALKMGTMQAEQSMFPKFTLSLDPTP